MLPVAFLAPALWSPFELLGATAVVVFGGCGGGLCGCGCGCLNPNNEERPCRCSCCCCCFCCCCVAERFLGPQSLLQPQVSLVVLGGGEAPGGASNHECEREAMNPCTASQHSSGVHALRNRAYALQLAAVVVFFFAVLINCDVELSATLTSGACTESAV